MFSSMTLLKILWIFNTVSRREITWCWNHLLHPLSEYLDVKINTLSFPELDDFFGSSGLEYTCHGWWLLSPVWLLFDFLNKIIKHHISTEHEWRPFLNKFHSFPLNTSPVPKINEQKFNILLLFWIWVHTMPYKHQRALLYYLHQVLYPNWFLISSLYAHSTNEFWYILLEGLWKFSTTHF